MEATLSSLVNISVSRLEKLYMSSLKDKNIQPTPIHEVFIRLILMYKRTSKG